MDPEDESSRRPEYRAYISLGSNIKPEENLRSTLDWLRTHWNITECSRIYRTTPVDMEPGADPVWNLVVVIATDLMPVELKKRLKQLEQRLGREKQPGREHYASRELDADILFYDPLPEDFQPDEEIYRQAYVGVPLSELVELPPGWDQSRQEWLRELGNKEIEEQMFDPMKRWF